MEQITRNDVLSYASASFTGFEMVKEVNPSIEDLFFYLVSSTDEQKP
jgi:hypothetical protein